MGAEGVLVFDDQTQLTALGGSEHSFIVLEDGQQDVLAFDPRLVGTLLKEPSPETDFIIFDSELRVTETLAGDVDFLLVDRQPEPARLVLEGPQVQDLLVVQPGGPPGQTGGPGPQGPPGPPGTDAAGTYLQDFGFATPTTTWTIVHNQNSLAMNVETVDNNGDSIEGYVRFVDANTIQVDWYYPTAGTARVFR